MKVYFFANLNLASRLNLLTALIYVQHCTQRSISFVGNLHIYATAISCHYLGLVQFWKIFKFPSRKYCPLGALLSVPGLLLDKPLCRGGKLHETAAVQLILLLILAFW